MEDAECFADAEKAAEYLAATASKRTYKENFPIYQVRGVLTPDDPNASSNGRYVLFGVLGCICILFAAVIIANKRGRASGKTWYPEGFSFFSGGSGDSPTQPAKRQKRHEGQELHSFSKGSLAHMDDHWSDDERESKRKRPNMGHAYSSDQMTMTDYDEPAEHRHWHQQHIDAADIKGPHAIMTPPTHYDGAVEVNVIGPCGMTPLMVAAIKGGGVDTGEDIEHSDERTVEIITDLVSQGADLNATMDKSGETSLHLAARYARADAAKKLLDAGKN